MLETKQPLHQFNSSIQQHNLQQIPKQFHFRKAHSQIIDQPTNQISLDLNIENGQSFICFQCPDQQPNLSCSQCRGTGYVNSNHPLVTMMNQIFNTKLTSPPQNQNKHQLISTKSSSNSNISDSLTCSDILHTSLLKNSNKYKKNKPESQRTSILQFLLTPLQTIIKQESNIQEKCQKCNICHYEFDGVKYNCPECENFNVCEQCYQTKRISHCHTLQKIQSTSSQKTAKLQFQHQNQQQHPFHQKQDNFRTEEIDNTHSDVDKLSFKSDQSVQLMFKGMETNSQSNNIKQSKCGKGFFQLHQIQNNQDCKNLRYCQNCNHSIQDCYWVCQTCSNQNQHFQICKFCYDNQTYKHPKSHNLGLNFFNFDENFLLSENNFTDSIKETTTNDGIQNFNSDIFSKSQTVSSLSSNSKSNEKQDPHMHNIGVIGHRDIFTGFHKENTNDHYIEQIISPIPRSIALTHSFKEKKGSPQSDSQIISELMKPKCSNKMKNLQIPEKCIVQKFDDQSRVQFDDIVIMDLGQSTDYNDPIKVLSRSQKRPAHKFRDQSIRDSESMLHSVSEINPETSILEMLHDDYDYVDYYCDICSKNPIKNVKYHCLQCEDYDLCSDCYQNRRLQHWHDHFRRDDGRQKVKKIKQNKQKVIKKAIQNLNRSISPSRKSIRFMK